MEIFKIMLGKFSICGDFKSDTDGRLDRTWKELQTKPQSTLDLQANI